jgi:hypothetical protein
LTLTLTRVEEPSAVGGTPALNTAQSGGARFPVRPG